MNQHDDEPRRSSGGYVPFMPGQGPRPNRAQRRAKDQIRARGRRRMERATVRALKQAQRQDLRPQLSEDRELGHRIGWTWRRARSPRPDRPP